MTRNPNDEILVSLPYSREGCLFVLAVVAVELAVVGWLVGRWVRS